MWRSACCVFSCGGFLWFLWWWFLGGSCNVWWVFGPSGLKLVVVVGLLGGGHRRGWGGFGCSVLWWVQIGVEVQIGLRFCVEVQIGVAGVVGFVAVLWWVLAAVCAVGVFFNNLVVGG